VLGTINGSSLIKTCCEGKRDSYKNFKWQYCPVEK
jgi:hypothetical protein